MTGRRCQQKIKEKIWDDVPQYEVTHHLLLNGMDYLLKIIGAQDSTSQWAVVTSSF